MTPVEGQSRMLVLIKVLHTMIWAFLVSVIFYILYSAVTDNITTLTWISIGLVICEGIVLLMFNMFCPLTLIARKYSDSAKENFDIYLPNWLARHNKRIFTSLFAIGMLIIIFRVLIK